MTAVELMRAFRLKDELLIFFEPLDAELWMASPQALLGGGKPCRMLGSTESHARVRALVALMHDGTYINKRVEHVHPQQA